MIDFGFYNEWIALLRSETHARLNKKKPGPVYIEMKNMNQRNEKTQEQVNEVFKQKIKDRF